MVRLGDLEVRENAAVTTLFRQLLCGVVTLRVLAVAPAPALAERFQRVAGRSLELLRGLQQVARYHLVDVLVQQRASQTGMLLLVGFVLRRSHTPIVSCDSVLP